MKLDIKEYVNIVTKTYDSNIGGWTNDYIKYNQISKISDLAAKFHDWRRDGSEFCSFIKGFKYL